MEPEHPERRNLNISGYVHPEDVSYKPKNRYSSITLDNSNENDTYKSAYNKGKYSTFSTRSDIDMSKSCPICGEIALYTSNDDFKESRCKNKHKWHTDTNGFIIQGRAPRM